MRFPTPRACLETVEVFKTCRNQHQHFDCELWILESASLVRCSDQDESTVIPGKKKEENEKRKSQEQPLPLDF